MKQVVVKVTATQRGKGPVVPYSHERGLQTYTTPAADGSPRVVIYQVPLYAVVVDGGKAYVAVRFGLRNNGTTPLPRRPCDSGLAAGRICVPNWLPHYSPHSFRGASRPGAWQLLPGKGFLIHEGADRAQRQVGGSIGCVEILDGRWNEFLAEIETAAGGSCAQIAAQGKLRVMIEHTRYPDAVLMK